MYKGAFSVTKLLKPCIYETDVTFSPTIPVPAPQSRTETFVFGQYSFMMTATLFGPLYFVLRTLWKVKKQRTFKHC